MTFYITSYYRFQRFTSDQLEPLRADILSAGKKMRVNGLFLLAEEGSNATLATPESTLRDELKQYLQITFGQPEILFKDSTCEKRPFRDLRVQIRSEIVTLDGNPATELPPTSDHKSFLNCQAWHEWVTSGRDYTLLDLRNWYEFKVGAFRGAVNPNLKAFGELHAYLEHAGIPKEKPVLMYCTGGVRCEKALPTLEQHGYSEVYQLHGGILKYLEEIKDGAFDGECFVFDNRVAVDKDLKPSEKYTLCPHCGNPASERIDCQRCSKKACICTDCFKIAERKSCSKNCRYHIEHKSGGKSQGQHHI